MQVGIGKSITHEEADVIMAYHMVQEATAGHSPIRGVSDDTDVLLTLTHHLHAHVNSLPHSIQVTMAGCSGAHAIIDVNEIVQQHSTVIPNLLGAHALNGCDTVSLLAGIGKATVFKDSWLHSQVVFALVTYVLASLEEVTESEQSATNSMAAFKLHCQRAHFQTALWKAAGMSSPPDLEPLQYS